jgi:hypothetical protein
MRPGGGRGGLRRRRRPWGRRGRRAEGTAGVARCRTGGGCALSPIIARRIGIKLVVATGLAAIAGGLCQISAASTPAATYEAVVTGMLLIGLGAGLLLPTATNSVVGSVPQGDSGIGSATNTVALQVGGALGVAVIGSAMLTRYQSHITRALTGRHVPIAATHTIIGSLGGALTVARSVGGTTGAVLARAARAAFMSGMQTSLAFGALVALAGALLALARLPSRTSQPSPDPSTARRARTATRPILTGPIVIVGPEPSRRRRACPRRRPGCRARSSIERRPP